MNNNNIVDDIIELLDDAARLTSQEYFQILEQLEIIVNFRLDTLSDNERKQWAERKQE